MKSVLQLVYSQTKLYVFNNNIHDPIHVLFNGLLWIKLDVQERRVDAQESLVVFSKIVIYIQIYHDSISHSVNMDLGFVEYGQWTKAREILGDLR